MTGNRLTDKRLVFQPAAYMGIQKGINKIVDAVKPTLGPLPKIVAIERILDERMPELLDDGGTIAKRIIQLKDPNEDVGAMIVRDFLLNLQDQVGDGTAIGAVLLQYLYNESLKYIVSGGNVARFKHYLKEGAEIVIDNLFNMITPLEGQEKLTQVAKTLCGNEELARMLGEIFDIIGEYGRLEIRAGYKRSLDREYIEGMYWERGVVSREMISNKRASKVVLNNPAILISDMEIHNPRMLIPVIEIAAKSKFRSLLIIGEEFSDSAIGLILSNNNPKKLKIVAVKTPGWNPEEHAEAIEDLSILTGGKPFIKAAGNSFDNISAKDFGFARQAWADKYNFGIIGGKGDPKTIRKHINKLRRTHEETADPVVYEKLRVRIGKLMGGTAVLWIGGDTELEINSIQEIAKKTSIIMREALRSGILPGGGTAYLDCKSVLERKLEDSSETDQIAAYKILLRGLEEPTRTIIRNAGYDDSEIIAQIKKAGKGYGFDALSGKIVKMMEAGIWDTASTLQSAFYGAVTTAIMALTIDVIVHRKQESGPVIPRTPGLKKRIKPKSKLG
ncbi:MAG: hypothetical protein DRP54_03605 [Spirochaetes bacterium]|nr:MAG: hypothetical protein DRP54_03605 [Spirochaetota bacterium]